MSEKAPPPSKKRRFDDSHGDDLGSGYTNRSTPVAMLSDDVLFDIFSINSRMDMIPFNKERSTLLGLAYEYDTLTTTRYSSQVCQHWRKIILSSATIWANSLNIDELNQPGDEWRYEVLKRTGNAPISLIGRVHFMYSDEGNHAVPFIMDILEHEWQRIKCLSICTNEWFLMHKILYMMEDPAPSLEHFLYWTTKMPEQEDDTFSEAEILFSDISPKLTFFSCQGVGYEFSNGSMANLRQLWLTGQRATFTIPELYHGLRHLPLLEELNIDHDELLDFVGLEDNTPILVLPRLEEITIHDCGMMLVANLIKYISPARGCPLVVDSDLLDVDLIHIIDVSQLGQVYATFINDFADFKTVPYISLTHTRENGFGLRAANGPCKGILHGDLPSSYPNLSFGYSDNRCRRRGELSQLKRFSAPILKALASRTDLGDITQLELDLDKTAVLCLDAPLLLFLKKLESVVHLLANMSTLLILYRAEIMVGTPILPRIRTITVTGLPNGHHDLGVFLEQRSQSGNPVSLLKLPKNIYRNDGTWRFLDEIGGLSVVWWDRSITGIHESQFVVLNDSLVPAVLTCVTWISIYS